MQNHKLYLALTFLPLLALPASALADWQYTKWGMTPEELISVAAEQGVEAKEYVPPKGQQSNSVRILVAKYTTGDYAFQAKFFFSKGVNKLTTVGLVLENKATCPALSNSLEAMYGSPPVLSESEFEREMGIRRARWIDKEKNNQVRFLYPPMRFSEPCELFYSEYAKPGASKGL